MPPRSLRRVGDGLDLGLEVGLGRLVGHVDAVAGRRRTSSRGRRSAGRPLRCGRRTATRRGAGSGSAIRPTLPLVSRKAISFSPSSMHAQRVAVGRGQLRRQHGGHPVLAHEVAHRRAWADAGDQLVFFDLQHDSVLSYQICYCDESAVVSTRRESGFLRLGSWRTGLLCQRGRPVHRVPRHRRDWRHREVCPGGAAVRGSSWRR